MDKLHDIINDISDICNTTIVYEHMTKEDVINFFYETLSKIDTLAKYPEDIDLVNYLERKGWEIH